MNGLRSLALPPLLVLLAACASSSDIQKQVFDCSSGHDVEIRAGLSSSQSGEHAGQYLFLIEVANNSDHDVTVKQVRVDPREVHRSQRRSAPLASAAKNVDVTIAEGTEQIFELSASSSMMFSETLRETIEAEVFELDVKVELSNGDLYRCPFEVQARR
jgi:hypothetical protein